MQNGILLTVFFAGLSAATTKEPTFFARHDYPSATGFVSVADVNGDGILDVVAISIGSSSVTTLLGEGNGLFRTGPTSDLGGYLLSSVPVDLNGDGVVDLLVGSTAGLGVSLGNGDGTFQPAVFYQGGGTGHIAVGDFNRDGFADVVLADVHGVWFYAGEAGGVFSPGVLTPVNPSGTGNAPVVVADFNGDGYLDVATTYYPFNEPVGFIVLFGGGNGTFQPPIFYKSPGVPEWIAG